MIDIEDTIDVASFGVTGVEVEGEIDIEDALGIRLGQAGVMLWARVVSWVGIVPWVGVVLCAGIVPGAEVVS